MKRLQVGMGWGIFGAATAMLCIASITAIGQTLVGTALVDETGLPAEGIVVKVFDSVYGAKMESGGTVMIAGADGRFASARLPAGIYYVKLSRGPFMPGQKYAEFIYPKDYITVEMVQGGPPPADLTFRLKRGDVITGRVITDNGDAIQHAVLGMTR